MGWLKDWREKRRQRKLEEIMAAKGWTAQILVADDGFIATPSFSGGSLYVVYTQALWTYICASRISQDISSMPAIVQERGADGAWQRNDSHELNRVLERPYGTTALAPRWNWQQQIAAGVLRQELGGNQFYRKTVGGGRLLSLGLLLAELTADEDTSTGLFDTYSVSGTSETIPADEVVNIAHPSPESWWRGVSPTVPNEQQTRVDYAASRRTRYDLETRVAPGVVFKVQGLFTLSEDQRDSTETYLAAQYEGATKAGKSLVVGDTTTIEGAPLHTVDDIPTHAANARDAIISSFDVSPPVVGVLRDVKYQTWEQALRAQFFLCVWPRVLAIYGVINSQAITPIYGPDVRLWVDLVQSPLGLAALRERGETAAVYQGLGWPAQQLNERFQLDMPPFDGWDTPNMSAIVAGHAESVTDGDETENDDSAE